MTPSENVAAPVIISLVIRVHDDIAAQATLLSRLRGRTELALGIQNGSWIPVVAETAAPQELHAWIEAQPEVAFVDVTFVEIVADENVAPCSGDFSNEPNQK